MPFPLLTPYTSEASFRAAASVQIKDQAYDSDTATLHDFHGDCETSATHNIIQEYVSDTTPQALDAHAPTINTEKEIKAFPSVSTLSRSSPGMKSILPHRSQSSTSATGSPSSRNRTPMPKASQSSLRGLGQLSEHGNKHVKGQERARKKPKGTFLPLPETAPSFTDIFAAAQKDMSRLGSDVEDEVYYDLTTTSPIQPDDDLRRSRKFDCGPTVRYSVDAREVIMGELR
jgi:hypothetical protein